MSTLWLVRAGASKKDSRKDSDNGPGGANSSGGGGGGGGGADGSSRASAPFPFEGFDAQVLLESLYFVYRSKSSRTKVIDKLQSAFLYVRGISSQKESKITAGGNFGNVAAR